MLTEAARRAVKQADSEDCDTVDIEHFEKILPQLVSLMFMHVLDVSVGCFVFLWVWLFWLQIIYGHVICPSAKK